MSENIVAVEPTIEAMARGLIQSASRVNGGHRGSAAGNLPRDWGTALDPVAGRVAAIFRKMASA